MAARSFSGQTLSVLAALEADPATWRHGYGIAKETGLRSGTLYPVLIRLAERGMVEGALGGPTAPRTSTTASLPADSGRTGFHPGCVGRSRLATAPSPNLNAPPTGRGRTYVMGALTRVLMLVLQMGAGSLGPERRDWADALLAEADETSPGWARITWLAGGLSLTVWEALRHCAVRAAAFIAGTVGVVCITWPGSWSDSAVPVNRAEVPVALGFLAVLPLIVRHYFGPIRDGWPARVIRVGVYSFVLAAIAGMAVQARDGQRLGSYFSDVGIIMGLAFSVIVGYVAVILIATSQRVRLNRSTLPLALAAGSAIVLFPFVRTGLNLYRIAPKWWGLTVLALPLIIGFAVTRLAGRDSRAKVVDPVRQGGLAAICTTGTAALMFAAIATVSIALFPQRVPLQTPPPAANGGCETCQPASVVIPPSLRHEYWVELSIDQAGGAETVVIFAPFIGVLLGAAGIGLASALRRRTRNGDERQAVSRSVALNTHP